MKNLIAAGDKTTVEAAGAILGSGGNAYDAAVAACFTAMVAEPGLTSAGGGGFLNAYPEVGKPILFDFFVDTPTGKVDKSSLDFVSVFVDFGTARQEFHIGKGSVGVPGTVAGLLHVHDRLGAIPLRTVLEPAIIAARDGVVLSDAQAYLLSILEPIMGYDDNGRKIFFQDGELLKGGDTLRMPEFADFLDELWREGSDFFYKGDVAKILMDSLEEGGLILRSDLEGYEVVEREPLVTKFHGHTILGNPPPACSGMLIDFTLCLLEAAGCTRNIPISTKELAVAFELTNRARHERLEGRISKPGLKKLSEETFFEDYIEAFAAIQEGPLVEGAEPPSMSSTTQISIIDRRGNAVSVTTTNGAGSGFVVPQTGIMMNNMLGEEDLNPLGFHKYEPGQRMSSMIAPTIVLDHGQPVLVTGSAGSSRIRSVIVQMIVNVLCHKMRIREATDAPRIHLEGDLLHAEPGVPEADLKHLECRYKVQRWQEPNLFFGGANSVNENDGAGDPRRGGYSLTF